MTVRILLGDCRDVLDTLPEASIQCCVTSPPYWGLRSYLPEGHPLKHREIGSEPTVDEWVRTMVDVFARVHRVLRPDGTLFLNLGDSYAGSRPTQGVSAPSQSSTLRGNGHKGGGPKLHAMTASRRRDNHPVPRNDVASPGYKPKDMIGQPWLVAFALRAAGWYLRQEIIWHKPNPMPESTRDRCTKSHEHIFLLSKSERYFWNFEAIQEPSGDNTHARRKIVPAGWAIGEDSHTAAAHQTEKNHRKVSAVTPKAKAGAATGRAEGKALRMAEVGVGEVTSTRNPRSVWTIPTHGFKGAHFATFPPELARRCIAAGTKAGDTVLDPFGGSGTVGLEADRAHCHAVLIDLDDRNMPMAQERISADGPLFAQVEVSA